MIFSAKSESLNDVSIEPLQPTWTNPLEHSSFTHWKPESEQSSISDVDLEAYETKRKKAVDEKAKKK
ncbi:hypothetical protein Y032_0033g2626 [Ancylostoma ceylanicum]|uniref:Uncharacterized protein n=1 Tax=Ancylostoma ceylanicum TaxID=53326 RepID=A0A016UMF4_9BILA|nr:hypothetical protein Y032_0033g2626 [Ancylostoma ceylanicum]